jgi:ATP-dependent RNA helicase HelY
MAANLVRSYTSEQAHHLLNLSFAQYQADRDIVHLESRLERRQRHLAELREKARSPYGDLDEYRRSMSAPEASTGMIGRDDPVTLALLKLRPGDIIYARKGRYMGRVAVVSTAHRKGTMRLTGITTRRDLVALTSLDFEVPPKAIGQIELPRDFAPTRPDFQREVAQRLERARVERDTHSRERYSDEQRPATFAVEDDPELDDRLKAATQAERVAREVAELRQRMDTRNQSIARDFDRVLAVLQRWGYVQGWSLTDAGTILARTFHESDLLVAESIRRGLFDDLEPASLAALASVFVYEHRSPEPPPAPWYPSPLVRRRWQSIAALSYELEDIERTSGLTVHRPPDPTFVAIAFAWAAGEGFAEVVADEDLTGGDFVRTMKQLLDLLRQMALVAPQRATRKAAEQAAEQLFRGVVAASSAVAVPVVGAEDADDAHSQG